MSPTYKKTRISNASLTPTTLHTFKTTIALLSFESHHVEGLLGELILLATQDVLESRDGLLQHHQASLHASEGLSHSEGLRHKALDLAGAGHSELVILRQLIHSQDGNDILQGFVGLQGLLAAAGSVVVAESNDVGVQQAGSGVQRVHSGVDS